MTMNFVLKKQPAQVLLKEENVTFSGFLERKAKVLSFKTWTKCYTIISNGNIYVYQTNTSQKPSMSCILSAFHHIQILKNRSQHPLWVFSLSPIVNSIPEMEFAAASEREMETWISQIRKGIIYSKNTQLRRVTSLPARNDKSNDIVDDDSQFNIYSTVTERDEVKNIIMNSNKDSIYEEPDDIKFQQSTSNPSAPPLVELYPSLSFDNSIADGIDGNEDNSIFYGTREEALSQLTKCRFMGSYLVRKENERQILTVRCEANVVKYCLQMNEKNKRVNIVGQRLCFDNIDHLISYYHEHDLPNQNCKLLIPYKLAQNAAMLNL